MIKSHREIIDLWPNDASLSKDLGVSWGLVRKWRERNNIPAAHWDNLLIAGKNRDFPISLDLLLKTMKKRAA